MNNLNLMPVLPEIFLSIAIMGILLIDLFLSDAKRHITYGLSILALAICAVMNWNDFSAGTTVYAFNNMFVSDPMRSEEHTSELKSLMRISYAVFCLKKKK